MSGVVKGVGKVFRRVTKGGGLLPAALATGAVLFTAGSALGISGMSDGWGGAVGGAVERVVGKGTLANVLSGAITKAGYGAVAGAATGVLNGDMTGAMRLGAIDGAIQGGREGYSTNPPAAAAMDGNGPSSPSRDPGALGTRTSPSPVNAAQGGVNDLRNVNTPASSTPTIRRTASIPLEPSAVAAAAANVTRLNDVTRPNAGLLPVVSSAGGAGDKGASRSWADSLFAKDGWLDRYGQQVGAMITGAGKTPKANDPNAATAQQQPSPLQQQQQLIQQNYAGTTTPGAHTGLLNAGAGLQAAQQGQPVNQTPGARFNQMIYGRTVWDPVAGRLVMVPMAQQT